MNLFEAKAHFSAIVDRAEAGETIPIVRRGRLVVKLVPASMGIAPIDIAALERLDALMPEQPRSAEAVLRELRDARY